MGRVPRTGRFWLLICFVCFCWAGNTGCGGSGRKTSQTTGALTNPASGGTSPVTLSLDPTEVPVTRLKDAVDSLLRVNPGDYIVGTGDKLKISILARNYSAESSTEEVVVRQDGKIYLKLLGEIEVSGQTLLQMQRNLSEKAGLYVKQPFVQITVTEYNSQAVTLVGELGGSGGGGRAIRVPIKGPTRLIQLLSTTIRESGQNTGSTSASPSNIADLSNIIITRHNGERLRVNLNTFLFGLDTVADVELVNGDFVFIPSLVDNRVFVLGEVAASGAIPIGLGLTAAEAITRAGGFTTVAGRNRITVIRGGTKNPEILKVAVLDVARKGLRDKDVYLRNGDIVYVPRSTLGDVNLILQQIIPPLQTYLLIETLFKR